MRNQTREHAEDLSEMYWAEKAQEENEIYYETNNERTILAREPDFFIPLPSNFVNLLKDFGGER